MTAASVAFLGTGEAFDERLPHTSLLLRTAEATLLFDCGALVPPRVWASIPDPDALHGVWISHLHADHAFGLAALLGRFWEDGRRSPLALLGAPGVAARAGELLETGYPGLLGRLPFALEERPVDPGTAVEFRGLTLRAEESVHGVRNLAVRVEARGTAPFCYSGDGAPTAASARLGADAAWVHECFAADGEVPGHATLEALERELRAQAPRRLGLVHVSRRSREAVTRRARTLAAEGQPVSVPEPGEVWTL